MKAQVWRSIALAAISACGTTACRDPIDLHRADPVVTNLATTATWYGPHPMDLGDVRDSTLASFYTTNATAYDTNVQASFMDYRLASSPQMAGLVTSVWDGVSARVLGRIYNPVTLGGKGWASYGPQAMYLQPSSTALNFTNIAVAFSSPTSFLTVFMDNSIVAGNAGNASFNLNTGSFNSFKASAGFTAVPASIQPNNGHSSDIAWDGFGNSYYLYNNHNGDAGVRRYSDTGGWEASTTGKVLANPFVAAGNSMRAGQAQILNDGLGVTALWLGTTAGPVNNLYTSWSLDTSAGVPAPFQNNPALSQLDVKTFAAASDNQGNVVAVFLQNMPGYVAAPTGTALPKFTVRNSDVRIYASARGASGTWTGPSQIDDDTTAFDIHMTTLYQDSLATYFGTFGIDAVTGIAPTPAALGGLDYFTPAIAYVGGGRFMAAFAMNDMNTGSSSIYVRGYTVGTGWDPKGTNTLLDSIAFSSRTAANVLVTEGYRYANDLTMVSDGQGNAMLIAQVVLPIGRGTDATLRSYAIQAYIYSAATGKWSAPFRMPNSVCQAVPVLVPGTPYSCWNIKPSGALFPTGEAVVVYPGPAAPNGPLAGNLRLYSMEYHP